MTYEVIILGHLHMPLYFIGTFTEYPYKRAEHSDTSPYITPNELTKVKIITQNRIWKSRKNYFITPGSQTGPQDRTQNRDPTISPSTTPFTPDR